jgi:hypothetical protein
MLATSPTTQDTTAAPVRVTLPELDFGIYRQIVATMQAAATDEQDRVRIGRAIGVLLGCQVLETATCGVYLVQSAEYSDLYYRATTLRCGCPDSLRRRKPCKHSHALAVVSVASAIAAREQREAECAPIPFVLTDKALAALDAPEPVPAA